MGSHSVTCHPAEVTFPCVCVVAIGLVGAVLNGVILYALIVSKQHKKQVLIFNQNLLDFFGSFFLFATHAANLFDIELSGARGHWVCVVVLSEALNFGPLLGSFMNLAAITIERYLKIVHHWWAWSDIVIIIICLFSTYVEKSKTVNSIAQIDKLDIHKRKYIKKGQ